MAPIHLREITSDGVMVPGDVAAELYAARLERGVDLRDISDELRIHYDHLLAIEEGRFSDLPGPAYVIGFLRSYAGYLDLDGDLLVERFKSETTEFEPRQDLNALRPYDEGGVPTGALILLALVLMGGAYGGWYYVVNLDKVAIEQVPEVPERMIAALAPEPEAALPAPNEPVPDETTAPQKLEPQAVEPVAASEPLEAAATADPTAEPIVMVAAEETAAPVIPAVLSEEPFEAILASAIEQNPVNEAEAAIAAVAVLPEPADPIIETQPVSEVPAPEPVVEAPPEAAPIATVTESTITEPTAAEPLETASLQPVVPPPSIESNDYVPRVFGQANVGSTITLRAREESWVQVTGENNELLLTRILRPGDTYYVPDRSGLMLMTGNAGGIEILVGGKITPPLGEIGKVRRRVLLDAQKLLAGIANDP